MCGVWRRESARVSRLSERPALCLGELSSARTDCVGTGRLRASVGEFAVLAWQRVGPGKRAAVAAGAPYAGWAAPPKGFGAMPPMDIAPIAACSTAEKPKASC